MSIKSKLEPQVSSLGISANLLDTYKSDFFLSYVYSYIYIFNIYLFYEKSGPR